MSWILLWVTSASNSNLQSRGKCPPFLLLSVEVLVLESPPVLRHLALVALASVQGWVPSRNGLPPGCGARTASRDTTGNHVKMFVLQEFPMLSTQTFLDSMEIAEGITFLAGFQWTQIQTETGRTRNGSKQSLVVMDLCLKVDGLLNWFIWRLSIAFCCTFRIPLGFLYNLSTAMCYVHHPLCRDQLIG